MQSELHFKFIIAQQVAIASLTKIWKVNSETIVPPYWKSISCSGYQMLTQKETLNKKERSQRKNPKRMAPEE